MRSLALLSSLLLGIASCRSTADRGLADEAARGPVVRSETPADPTLQPPVVSGAEAPADEPLTRAERFELLADEFDDEVGAYDAALRAVEDGRGVDPGSARWPAFDLDAWLARMQVLVDEDPADDVAFDVLCWMLYALRYQRSPEPVASLIAQHHLGREELADVLPLMWASPTGKDLGEELSTSPHPAVRAAAEYCRCLDALTEFSFASRARELADPILQGAFDEQFAYEPLASAATADVEALAAAADRAFVLLAERYGDEAVGAWHGEEATFAELAADHRNRIAATHVGALAPAVVGTAVTGEEITPDFAHGQVRLIVVHCFDCQRCQPWLEKLRELSRLHEGRPLAILGLVPGVEPARALEKSRELGLGWPMLAGELHDSFSRTWTADSPPHVVAIDARGRLRFVTTGDLEILERVVEGLLAEVADESGPR